MTIRISNTNSSGSNKTAVRVYNNDVLVAEVFPNKYNPLAYIRKHNGQYRKSLIAQCINAGVGERELLESLKLNEYDG